MRKIKTMYRLLSFLSILALLSSCTIQENIHFNADFSGTYKIKVDMSALMEFGAAMADSTEEAPQTAMFTQEQLDSIALEMTAVKGLTNFNISEENYVLNMSMDFADVNVFADMDLMSSMSEETAKPAKPRFEVSGKNLIYNFDADYIKNAMGQGETGAEGEAEDDMGMNEMFNFQTVLTFDKPVSKVKSKIGEYNADSKEVVFNYNLKQAIEESKDWTTTITLGK